MLPLDRHVKVLYIYTSVSTSEQLCPNRFANFYELFEIAIPIGSPRNESNLDDIYGTHGHGMWLAMTMVHEREEDQGTTF